jgi:DNA-binding transcriptional MerR regulator
MKTGLVGTSYAARELGLSEVRIRQLAETGELKVKLKTMDGKRLFDDWEIQRLKKARETKRRLRESENAQP